MKCGLCSAPIMGHGHKGEPLVKGIVCGNCNLGVMYSKVKHPNQAANELVIIWCKQGKFVEELKKHDMFSVGG